MILQSDTWLVIRMNPTGVLPASLGVWVRGKLLTIVFRPVAFSRAAASERIHLAGRSLLQNWLLTMTQIGLLNQAAYLGTLILTMNWILPRYASHKDLPSNWGVREGETWSARGQLENVLGSPASKQSQPGEMCNGQMEQFGSHGGAGLRLLVGS